MLAKRQRISAGQDFHNIYKAGQRIPGRYVLVFFHPGQQDHNRVGFVVSKKVGNAVIRNRVKRRLRAILHDILPLLNTPFDIVINARPGISGISSEQMQQDLFNTFKKARLC